MCTEGRLILLFTFDDLMRIKTWHFTISHYNELIPRSMLAVHVSRIKEHDCLTRLVHGNPISLDANESNTFLIKCLFFLSFIYESLNVHTSPVCFVRSNRALFTSPLIFLVRINHANLIFWFSQMQFVGQRLSIAVRMSNTSFLINLAVCRDRWKTS